MNIKYCRIFRKRHGGHAFCRGGKGPSLCAVVSAACALVLLVHTVSAQEQAGHARQSSVGREQSAEHVQQNNPPVITISPDKVQLIGVRTDVADYRSLDKQIRTVGKIEPDETRLAFVNTKIAGWVKKLYVDYTGKEVMKGQPLLSLYSPDLVTAQEEYLIALRSATHGQQGAGDMKEEASGSDLLESAERRLSLWDISESQIAELAKTGKPQTEMIIEAPLSGVVLEKMVLEGGYITPGMNLYKIADLSSIWIMADIYEYEVPLVKVGQSALVTLPYYSGQSYRATINYIYPALDPLSRTIKVRLSMKNPGLLLKPEMFANVEIKVASGSRLVIPREAVIDSGTRQVVYIEKKPGLYEMRTVTLGQRGEDYVEVLKGIKRGERVVTSGNFLIDSESQLRSGQ